MAYLDNAAGAPLRPEAAAAIRAATDSGLTNPSGAHAAARRARDAIDAARDTVAAALGVDAAGVVFTSGGTEADNLAVGAAGGARTGALVCSAIEHHAVLRPVLAAGGRTVAVTGEGVVDLARLDEALDPTVALVSVMAANNETGAIQPLDEVVAIVRAKAPGAVVHTDAVQALPWMGLSGALSPVARCDLVAISAHKIGGPAGVGALATRGVPVRPLLLGGGQERGRRSGTPNVTGILAMAAAMRAATEQRADEVARVRALRDRLEEGLAEAIDGVTVSAAGAERLVGHCHLTIDGVESEALLVLLDEAGIAASGGAACASGALDPSHVLLAMGATPAQARSGLRLSLGWATTASEVDKALDVVPKAVGNLRRHSRRIGAGVL